MGATQSVPDGQAKHALVAGDNANRLGPQLKHATDDVELEFGLYFSYPHAVQAAAAAVSPYFPASHATHELALEAVVDAL